MFKNRKDEDLILGSSSPRRRELLSGCGILFQVIKPDVDEQRQESEDGASLVQRLALLKARAVVATRPEAWIIAADTTVVSQHEILEKPRDAEDAVRMLGLIQGRWHEVFGGLVIANQAQGIEHVEVIRSEVKIRSLSEGEMRAYVKTGEPMDKAGSYAIQGIGAALVEEVKGSYTNVVGIDLAKVVNLLLKYKVIEIAN